MCKHPYHVVMFPGTGTGDPVLIPGHSCLCGAVWWDAHRLQFVLDPHHYTPSEQRAFRWHWCGYPVWTDMGGS